MNENLICYKRMPVWTKDSLPKMFQEKHNTKAGTWGKITVLKGKLKFYVLTENGDVISEHVFTPENETPFVEPQLWHRVEALADDLECYLEFHCSREEYFSKKYNMTATHPDVISAYQTVGQPRKVLDLGCGQGRNALYLALQGCEVAALDHNPGSISFLADTAEKENLPVKAEIYDINSANIQDNYDVILSTVVFMFLNRQAIPQIIKNMQEHTNPGGYNLIIAAMDTADAPCPLPFSFTFKQGELKEYYKDWEFIEYNENMGALHKTDENGNRIRMRFATMLAKKK